MTTRHTTRSVTAHESSGAGVDRSSTGVAPEEFGTTLLGERLLSYARLAAAMHAQADAGRAHQAAGITEGRRA